MDDTETLVRRLLAAWATEGVEPLPPPDPLILARLEAANGVRLPTDLWTYFELTGGLPEGHLDARHLSWWSAPRIKPLSSIYRNFGQTRGFFVLADILVECTHYAIQVTTHGCMPYGTVVEGDGSGHLVRACSWNEFLRLRLEDPDRITLWSPEQHGNGPLA